MAVREIKTTLAVDGERAFNKAVTEAGRNMRVMASEMKAAAADFNLTGDEMEYLGRKSKSLNDLIAQQEAIIKALEGAVRDSAEAYGDASAKTDGYRIKLNNAQASLAKLKKELEDTGDETGELTREFKEMSSGIGDSIADISSASKISAFRDLGDMIGGALDTLSSFVDETEEYRRQMSFLEQNAADYDFNAENIKAQLGQIASLTGDADGAFEAISNLMATGFDGQELASAIDNISGAVIKFPETMKFENLAESLQESVASGSATGAYAELIERLGGDLDALNTQLANAATAEERQQIALAALNDGALKQTAENYKAMNADLIANETAQINFNTAMAGLGEALVPAETAWTNFKTGVITGITEMIGGIKEWNDNLWKDREDAKQIVDQTVEEAMSFSTIEEYTDAIAQADAEGAYVRANALMAERDKFLKDQAKKTAEEIDKASKQDAETIGGNITTEMGNGIIEGSGGAIEAARSVWQAIQDIFSQTITIPAPKMESGGVTGAAASAAGGTTTGGTRTASATLTLDGREVGRGMVDYNSYAMGAELARMETYG